MSEEESTGADMQLEPRDESAQDATFALLSTRADDARDDFRTPRQRGESKGDQGALSSPLRAVGVG